MRLSPAAAVVAATVLAAAGASAQGAAPSGERTVSFVDARTGVNGWRFEDNGLQVQLIQRLPDQTKAFFLGRGFDSAAADRLAGRCLFQTIVHNTQPSGGADVRLDLHEWRVLTEQETKPLLLKETWQQRWADMGVSERARIAFQWSFFPTRQQFAPGDWNMGMTSYPVEPGSPLTVEVVWHSNGQRQSGVIRGPVCATNDLAAEIKK